MSFDDYSSTGTLPFIPTHTSPDGGATNSDTHETKLELIHLTQHSSDRSENPRVFRTPKPFQKQPRKKDPFSSYALAIKRKFTLNTDGKPRFDNEELEIHDPNIRKAMLEVLSDYPFIELENDPIQLKPPFRELLYYYDDLQEYTQRQDLTPQDQKAMAFFLQFINDRLGESIEEQKRLFQKGEMSFPLLWTIYRPGSTVVAEEDGVQRCLVVHDPSIPGSLRCYYWGYKGGYFGRVETTIEQSYFQSNRSIGDLSAIPLDWLPEGKRQNVTEKLIRRGQKWESLINSCHRSYTGIVTKLTKGRSTEAGAGLWHRETFDRAAVTVNGRIILDPIKFEENHSGAVPKLAADTAPPKRAKKTDWSDICRKVRRTPSNTLSRTQALLCPITIPGYSLDGNFWAEFRVDLVEEIKWEPECFASLQLAQERKDTLLSLIESHEASRQKVRGDVFRKNLGRIFLLHGPPGCGKTLTAETISERVHKPLYRVTTGQLGIQPSVVEAKLREVLDLAQAWEAVLLIDEADVFLAARKTEDLARNAFVSIFLRLLEYYQGIMILTTNRLRDFDEAFRSRIHVDLEYDIPDEACRTAIWAGLFEANQIQETTTSEDCARLGRDFVLNGRDIKNLFTTALAIGGLKSSDGKVRYQEIETLYRISSRYRTADSSTEGPGSAQVS